MGGTVHHLASVHHLLCSMALCLIIVGCYTGPIHHHAEYLLGAGEVLGTEWLNVISSVTLREEQLLT